MSFATLFCRLCPLFCRVDSILCLFHHEESLVSYSADKIITFNNRTFANIESLLVVSWDKVPSLLIVFFGKVTSLLVMFWDLLHYLYIYNSFRCAHWDIITWPMRLPHCLIVSSCFRSSCDTYVMMMCLYALPMLSWWDVFCQSFHRQKIYRSRRCINWFSASFSCRRYLSMMSTACATRWKWVLSAVAYSDLFIEYFEHKVQHALIFFNNNILTNSPLVRLFW